MKRQIRVLLTFILLLLFLAGLFYTPTFAYWIGSIKAIEKTENNHQVLIGEWQQELENSFPENTVDLDKIINEESTKVITSGTYFIYHNQLYISTGDYVPLYHGNPGEQSSMWALVSFELDWQIHTRYLEGAVVRIDHRYFIGNQSWLVDNPLTHHGQWNQWREIDPMTDEMFELLPGTNRPDYSKPKPNYIVYK